MDMPQKRSKIAVDASSRAFESAAGQQETQRFIGADQPGGVASSQGHHRFTKRAAQIIRNASDHSKIHESQLPAGVLAPTALLFREGSHKQVPGVRVGVEEAIRKDLFQIGIQQSPRHLCAVDACGSNGGVIGDLYGVYIFKRQDSKSGQRGDSARDMQTRNHP